MNARSAAVLWLAALAAGAAGSARADDTPSPRGMRLTPGSSVRADIGEVDTFDPAGDVDAYVLPLAAGQRAVVSLRVAPGSRLVPAAEVFREDGSAFGAESGLVTTARGALLRLAFTADGTGLYEVRVRAAAPDAPGPEAVGSYRLSVAIAAQPPGKAVATADAAGVVRFTVPAEGGARLTAKLTASERAPALVSLADPDGVAVEEAPAAALVRGRTVSLRGFPLPPERAFGDWQMAFSSAPGQAARLSWSVTPPRGRRPVRVSVDAREPVVTSYFPEKAAPGGGVSVEGTRFFDAFADEHLEPAEMVRLFAGRHELAVVSAAEGELHDPDHVVGTLPEGIAPGTYPLFVRTATGQVAVAPLPLVVVPGVEVTSVEPRSGPTFGGFEMTLGGSGFREGRVAVRVDGNAVLLPILETTPTSVRFVAPPHAAGPATFGVRDIDTGSARDAPHLPFDYRPDPLVREVVPAFVPVLAGEPVALRGDNFTAATHVFLERDGAAGAFEEIVPAAVEGSTVLRFTAPVRAAGPHRLFVRAATGLSTRASPDAALGYFSFAELPLGLEPSAAEPFDAWTNALADFDGDGDLDLFLARRGAGPLAASPHTRVLRNDGAAGLTDATASVMPAVTAQDDWRADRVAVADLTQDGRPDVLVATSDGHFPGTTNSHVRILVNEQRTAGGDAADRVFRDRTIELMPPPRWMTTYAYPSGSQDYVSDAWRALDLWIGDLDPAVPGPPDILLVDDETRDDANVSAQGRVQGVFCGNYCGTPFPSAYPYAMYWGGARRFSWDPAARGGLGRFKFQPYAFPMRKSLTFDLFGAPPGSGVFVCNENTPCKGTFPPWTGKRIVAGNLDGDSVLDVAVVSDTETTFVNKRRSPADVRSALFVARAGKDPWFGSTFTDLTPEVAALALDLRGDAIAIGRPGTDASASGFVAVSVASPAPGTGSVLRILRHVPPSAFQDVTSVVVPAPSGGERGQASAMQFADVDGDGDEDLVLLAPAAPGAGSALRVLRNLSEKGAPGVFDRSLQPLFDALASPVDRGEGVAFAIGDLDGDGGPDVVTSRPSGGAEPGTRAAGSVR